MKKIIAPIIFLLSLYSIALANGSHGQYFENNVGTYTVGVGTDVFTLVAGDPIRFDFNLYKKDSRERVPFTDIWVRIVEKGENLGSKTIFAGGLHNPAIGYAGMTTIVPNGGTYELILYFNQDGKAITEEASFPLTIEGSLDAKPNWQKDALEIAMGAFFGLIIAFFFRKKT